MIVAEVSQFFIVDKNISWQDFIKVEKGVLPDSTNTTFLWTEKPIVKQVLKEAWPTKGNVWYRNYKNKPKLFKFNYDTSD